MGIWYVTLLIPDFASPNKADDFFLAEWEVQVPVEI